MYTTVHGIYVPARERYTRHEEYSPIYDPAYKDYNIVITLKYPW